MAAAASSSPYHLPVTAAQVGTYFVGQYYQMLQTQPEMVHQFYNERSSVLRVDGHSSETASGMQQINALVVSLNYKAIDIETTHSLESWERGVLVAVSGSVQMMDYSSKRRFVQTFFLAPQDKGYFLLNDTFHFVEEESINHHPVTYLAQTNIDPQLNASAGIPEQVYEASEYFLHGDIQAREYMASSHVEDGTVDYYSFHGQSSQQVHEAAVFNEDDYAVHANGSVQSSMYPVQEHFSSPVEETVGEPKKHTYASILQVSKKQPAAPMPQHHYSKATPPASEWNHVGKHSAKNSFDGTAAEHPEAEAKENVSALENEVEIKSVYVKNVPSNASASEMEAVFKKFGKLGKDKVAIRTRKDIGVCYAFVEFADITGVQNAIKAGTVEIAGQQVYIEGRRPNSSNPYLTGKGRGRSSTGYQTDSRGRSNGQSHAKGNGQGGSDRDYKQSRSNGYHRQGNWQEKTYSSSKQRSRNGHSPSD